jgi:hypothetical protein
MANKSNGSAEITNIKTNEVMIFEILGFINTLLFFLSK